MVGVPPHDLDLCFKIFFSSAGQTRSYEGGRLRYVLDSGDALLMAEATPTGAVKRPKIDISLWGVDRTRPEIASGLIDQFAGMLNLRLDLRPFYERFEYDPIIGNLASHLMGLKPIRTQTMYESLVVSIVGQQISTIAAASMQRRLVDLFGEKIVVGGRTFFSFPRPARLAAATIKQLMKCALSTRKAEYIRDISRSVIRGEIDLESLGSVKDSEEIIQRLIAIRGIGRWTAELAAIRGLGRYDVVPADDVGLRKTVARYYGLERASGEDVRRVAESWGEWKGMATYYLYVASRLGLVFKARKGRSAEGERWASEVGVTGREGPSRALRRRQALR